MDRRNWMRMGLLAAALAVGVVAVAPSVAPAAIPAHVQTWLTNNHPGWQDGGHDPGPPHNHIILDANGNRIGIVYEDANGDWEFESIPGGVVTPIPGPTAEVSAAAL